MVARVRSARGPAPSAVSARVRDRALVIRLFEAMLRAQGIAPSSIERWLEQASSSYGTAGEPGSLCAIRAALAVLDGFPVEAVRRGFPEGGSS